MIDDHQHHHGPTQYVDGVNASNRRRRPRGRRDGSFIVRERGRFNRHDWAPFQAADDRRVAA